MLPELPLGFLRPIYQPISLSRVRLSNHRVGQRTKPISQPNVYMIKPICDISGKTPAVPVQIIAEGKVVLSLDLSQVEVAALVQSVMDKMQVTDVAPVMKTAQVNP